LNDVWGGFLVDSSLMHFESSVHIGGRSPDFDRVVEPGDETRLCALPLKISGKMALGSR
jgi:hypothetical protein